MSQAAEYAEPTEHDLNHSFALVADDFAAVDDFIRRRLHSEVVLVNQVAEYIVSGGGKRLRPLLLLLASRACEYDGNHHIILAAVVEFIHTATLLHDDVVDESDMRRGRRSAHAVWGNAASVLVGDFLYSRSFQMMVEVESMRVMDILAQTTNTIAEGEVLQLLNLGNPDVDEARYMRVIENKTAKLFEAAARLGAVISGRPAAVEQELSRFGRKLGSAFQIADDVLDYAADADKLGKNLGDDLAEGKPTLPLIYARERADQKGRLLIDNAIRNPADAQIQQVTELVISTGALAAARARAREIARQAKSALDCLPDTAYRQALMGLCDYAVSRGH